MLISERGGKDEGGKDEEGKDEEGKDEGLGAEKRHVLRS